MCLAIPGEIIRITNEKPFLRSGMVSFDGIHKETSLALVPDARIGDYVIVHAGVAISIVDENEANKVFEMLRDMIKQVDDR